MPWRVNILGSAAPMPPSPIPRTAGEIRREGRKAICAHAWLKWFLDVPSGIAMDSEFRILGDCERRTCAIDLMKYRVPHAQRSAKTDLSAAAVGDFGLDTGLFMRPVATARLMAKTKVI
jgi:hypothetical protein